MPGIFGDDFLSLLSPFATAQYRPTPSATFPSPAAPAPGSLSIPPAQPPVFLSPPDPAGAAPAQPAGASGSLGPSINNGLGNSLANGINNHALTLMALGAGIAQGGVGKGLAAAAAAAQAERNLQAQQVNFRQTYNALTGAGVPADEALAAVMNPSLMRTLAVKYLGPRSSGNAASASVPAAAAASAANNPASDFQANASSMTPAPVSAPALPPNVPSSARYSPSRNVWRDPDGNRFDRQGKAFP